MATHSSAFAWRIPGTGEPGGLPSMASHRVGHDWSDLAAAVMKLPLSTETYIMSKMYTKHQDSAYISNCWGRKKRKLKFLCLLCPSPLKQEILAYIANENLKCGYINLEKCCNCELHARFWRQVWKKSANYFINILYWLHIEMVIIGLCWVKKVHF